MRQRLIRCLPPTNSSNARRTSPKFLLCLLQQPQIILLREGTDTSQGKPQLISNINACMAVVDAVRSTLGPRGMDKLVIDDRVSPDGLAEHPADSLAPTKDARAAEAAATQRPRRRQNMHMQERVSVAAVPQCVSDHSCGCAAC